MNKKIGIGIAIVIVLVLLGWMLLKNKQNNTDVAASRSTGANTEHANSMSSSFQDLLALGTAKTCTYEVGEGLGSGTVYVAGGKMRGDTEVKTANVTTRMHMIVDGKTSYSWAEGQDTGYKMDFAAMKTDSMKGSDMSQNQTAVDVNKNYNFKCSNWSVDTSKFTLPTGVTFKDMAEMMQGMPKAPTGQTQTIQNQGQNMAAMCDSLQEPAKSQCLAALKGKQ